MTGYPSLNESKYEILSGSSSIVIPVISSTPSGALTVGLSGSSGLGMTSKAGEYPKFNDESNTGLNVKSPVVPTASSAFSWSVIPGNCTRTEFSPLMDISGSCTSPNAAILVLIISTACSINSLSVPSSAVSITEIPPCKSNPSFGCI